MDLNKNNNNKHFNEMIVKMFFTYLSNKFYHYLLKRKYLGHLFILS